MFSVDTEAEAREAQVRFCVLRYDNSMGWTDWPRGLDQNDWRQTYDALHGVTDELRAWWSERHPD